MINFPNNPNPGEQYTYAGRTWQWQPGVGGARGKWLLVPVSSTDANTAAAAAQSALNSKDAAAESAGEAAASADAAAASAQAAAESEEAAFKTLPVESATPPTDPLPGSEWVHSVTGRRYTWIVDGGTGQWVETYAGQVVDNYARVTQFADDLASTDPGKGAAMVGFRQDGAGAVARSSFEKLADVVSVKDFGAKGDGITDDTSAIQAAITYASSRSATLSFPSGSYLCSGVSVTGGQVKLVGNEQARIVLSDTALGFLSATGCSLVSVNGFEFEDRANAARSSISHAMISLSECPRIEVRNNTGSDLHYAFLHADLAGTYTGETHVHIQNNVLDGKANFGTNSYTAMFNFQGPYKGGRVSHNDIDSVNGNGFRVFQALIEPATYVPPEDWVFHANRIVRCLRPSDGEGQCIYYRGHDLVLRDNYFALAGRNVVDVQGPGNQETFARGIRVFGNTFLNRPDVMNSGAACLLHLRCCEAIVVGNKFYGAGPSIGHSGIIAKWGGSLIATDNDFGTNTIDGFEHLIPGDLIEIGTASSINSVPFKYCVVKGNVGHLYSANRALLHSSSSSDQAIRSVVISANSIRGSANRWVFRATENYTEGSPRLRSLIIDGNIVEGGGVMPDADVSKVFFIEPINYGRLATANLPTAAPHGSVVFNTDANRPMWWNNQSTAKRWEFADGTSL